MLNNSDFIARLGKAAVNQISLLILAVGILIWDVFRHKPFLPTFVGFFIVYLILVAEEISKGFFKKILNVILAAFVLVVIIGLDLQIVQSGNRTVLLVVTVAVFNLLAIMYEVTVIKKIKNI